MIDHAVDFFRAPKASSRHLAEASNDCPSRRIVAPSRILLFGHQVGPHRIRCVLLKYPSPRDLPIDLPDRSYNHTVKLFGNVLIATWTACLTDHPGLYSAGVRKVIILAFNLHNPPVDVLSHLILDTVQVFPVFADQSHRVPLLLPSWIRSNLDALWLDLGRQLGQVRGHGALGHWRRYKHSIYALALRVDEAR